MGRLMLLGLFVDDILSSFHPEDDAEWCELKARFMQKYKSKDMGEARLILGMRLQRDRTRRMLRVHQQAYAEAVLHHFGMADCKPAATREQTGVQLMPDGSMVGRSRPKRVALDAESDASDEGEGDEADAEAASESAEEESARASLRVRYQSVVGALLYLSMNTRIDLCHAVNMLSRYVQAPTEAHWALVKRVMRYLKGTTHLALVFDTEASIATGLSAGDSSSTAASEAKRRGEASQSHATPQLTTHESDAPLLTGWSDADWGGSLSDRRSTTGYVLQLHGCALTWQSKKQASVAQSTGEAEYMRSPLCCEMSNGRTRCCTSSASALDPTRHGCSTTMAAARPSHRISRLLPVRRRCTATTSRPWRSSAAKACCIARRSTSTFVTTGFVSRRRRERSQSSGSTRRGSWPISSLSR